MIKKSLPWACAALLAVQASFSLGADATRGKQLYESRCGGCHSIEENRAGPAHKGVFGRKAGMAKGFDYSPAVKSSRIIWNARTLDRWLANTEATIPGNKMGFAVPDPVDRADIIEYLRTAK